MLARGQRRLRECSGPCIDGSGGCGGLNIDGNDLVERE